MIVGWETLDAIIPFRLGFFHGVFILVDYKHLTNVGRFVIIGMIMSFVHFHRTIALMKLVC